MSLARIIALLLFSTLSYQCGAQGVKLWEPINQKGKFWILWGYNRSAYSNSDIHFKGSGYEFTLYDVEAADDPSSWDAGVYIHPKWFTIPQFNFRAGYFFRPNYSLSFGWDHMKYKISNTQTVNIDGHIDEDLSVIYGGNYDNTPIKLTSSFLRYEHTDGLNYVRLQLDRFDNLISIGDEALQLHWMNGIGVAAVMPWTDATWLGERHLNALHLGGFGINVSSGLRLQFLKHFFAQATVMGGYINLLNVTVDNQSDDRAKQQFWFEQHYFSIGGLFRIGKEPCQTCPDWRGK